MNTNHKCVELQTRWYEGSTHYVTWWGMCF